MLEKEIYQTYNELERKKLQGKVLYPGSKAYQDAIFIGNLLYRFKSPACVVMVESYKDIQTTVRFAKKYNYKLNVKNGGHSYAGYCLNEGGIVLDLSKMTDVKINTDSKTLMTQSGSTWIQLYEKLKVKDEQYMVLGGQCPTVGVSGFTLGGGLSTFSRSYGLAIDNLLAVKHVTADGNLIELTNQETDTDKKDLFWALAGGGGGNFGVTVEFTFRIHKLPNPTVVCGELTWNIPQQEQEFKDAMDAFNSMDAPNELCIDAFWNYDSNGQFQAMMTTIYNGTMDECNKVLDPILKFNPSNSLKNMHWIEWERQEEGFSKLSNIYNHHVSFIMAEGAITREVTNTIMELLETAPALIPNSDPTEPNKKQCHILWDNIGGVTKNIAKNATPFYWREGVYVMTAMIAWETEEQTPQAMAWSQRCKELLAPHSIEGKAAYLNYIDDTLDNWQKAYYGNNYQRLQEIKSKVDPTNFFYFKQSVEPIDKDEPSKIWQNWGECVIAKPSKHYRPKSKNEIIRIIDDARKNNKTIRVVGSGHTWSPLVPTKDIFVSMENFKSIEVSDDKQTVTIGSGVTVDELSPVLISNNICFESNVGHGVGEATYGGIVSTGCHGSGIKFQSTSDLVVALEVITSNGENKTFTNSDGEIMNAARLSLGMFGIITKITFAVKPAFNVKVEEFKYPVDKCLEEIKSFVLNNDYAEVTWIPYTDEMYMQKANRTEEEPTRIGTSPHTSEFDKTLNTAISATALNVIINDPTQTPDIMKTGMRLLPLYNYVSNITDYLHNSDYHAILAYKVSDIEIAIEIDEGFNSVRKAVMLTQQRVKEWQNAGLFPFNGALGFRFIKNSDAILSQARGNKYTALVEFISYFKTDLFEKFSGELVQELIDELPKARPHWAKGFQFMPETIKYVQKSFGSQLDEFNKLKEKSGVDPNGIFINEFLKPIFKE